MVDSGGVWTRLPFRHVHNPPEEQFEIFNILFLK